MQKQTGGMADISRIPTLFGFFAATFKVLPIIILQYLVSGKIWMTLKVFTLKVAAKKPKSGTPAS